MSNAFAPADVLFPDVELLVTEHLTEQLGSAVKGVSTTVPNPFPQPWVLVERIGGYWATLFFLERARIQTSCYAADKTTAQQIAQQVRLALNQLPDVPRSDAVVTQVIDDLGITWQPDPVGSPPYHRYLLGFSIWLHPPT